ncbi:dTDP-4-dehydrorhamnose reductase [Flavihumibacter sp. ZG627]|uniref:dTDP-4-dehydrorhamnose reductase n=1 Tax=Flavihumibacter sp. ZG627 TaxID=1463156 RepID=UPI00057FCDCD|nr:dTDP-4-dehydrorhamnose reductase [Flavihumibacter sp. ZG627]KIC90357.1 dTDP-4-dehydrorhamnose reductase [Flavihumibacter sp. ZG627]
MKKILVTGSGGQLGTEIRQLSAFYPGFQFIFADSETLPIDKEAFVESYISSHKPDYCINCAAYTAVDKAETEVEKANQINGTAVGYLAKSLNKNGGRLIHISTDYVFDGSASKPLKETDKVHPLGIYGSSKLKGEELAMDYAPDSIILRTSWVYSAYGNNFVKTMLRLMSQREELNVVADQIGSPTYAADLAKAILDIIVQLDDLEQSASLGGIYHYSNDANISWYDFALAIKELSGSKCKINPIASTEYPTPAARPAYSVFDKQKISKVFGLPILNWKESLQICMLQLQQYLA